MDVSELDLVYALCAAAGSCQDCCTVDRLYIVLGSRRRAAQKRACVVWERVSVIYSRLCVWCACDADLSDTLVSTHPLNHGRSVRRLWFVMENCAEHVWTGLPLWRWVWLLLPALLALAGHIRVVIDIAPKYEIEIWQRLDLVLPL